MLGNNKMVMTVAALAGALLGGAAISGIALAQAQPNPAGTPSQLERVYACSAITEDAARLACFDTAVSSLKTAQAQGEITTINKEQAKQLERESFGFNLPSLPTLAFPNLFGENREAQQTAEVSTRIVRISGRTKPVFHLENGQVWESIDSETNRSAREGGAVTVRRAFSGSFLLSVEAGGAALRVRRVQ